MTLADFLAFCIIVATGFAFVAWYEEKYMKPK